MIKDLRWEIMQDHLGELIIITIVILRRLLKDSE